MPAEAAAAMRYWEVTASGADRLLSDEDDPLRCKAEASKIFVLVPERCVVRLCACVSSHTHIHTYTLRAHTRTRASTHASTHTRRCMLVVFFEDATFLPALVPASVQARDVCDGLTPEMFARLSNIPDPALFLRDDSGGQCGRACASRVCVCVCACVRGYVRTCV